MSDDIFANLPAQADELGPPQAYLRDRPRWALIRRIGALLIGGLGCTVLGMRIALDSERYRDAFFWVWMPLVIVGAANLASAAYITWKVQRRRRERVLGVVRCPGGLVCVRADRDIVVSWDEIDTIWEHGRRFRIHGGEEIALPQTLEGVADLAEALYRETFQRMSICASAVILGGGSKEFGPVKLTRDAISMGSRQVALAEAGMIVLGGRLIVFRGGRRIPAFVIPLARVPNIYVLLALLDRLREVGFGSIVIGPQAAEPPEEP